MSGFNAGKCLTTGSWGEKEAWFIAFAHFCDVNTPAMVCFKLRHEVICLAKFLKLAVSSQALLSWSKPVVAHQCIMTYSLFCSDQSAWRSVGLWSPSIFQYRCCSITKSCPTVCDPMDCSMPSFPVLQHFQNLLKLMSIESVMPSSHLTLWHPLLLSSIFPSIKVFSNKSALRIRWPKNWSFSFSISLSNEYSVLIFLRIDWFDLLAVQEFSSMFSSTIIQRINSLALSLLYGPNLTSVYDYWKNHNLDYTDLCQQRAALLFNILSRFVIAFLPRSNSLLISWLYSPSTVILEPKKIKTVSVSTFSPCICHEVMGPDATISVFWMLSFKFFSMHAFPFTYL